VEYNGVRGALAHSWRRLFSSLKNHGFSGTFERAFVKAPAPPQSPVRSSPHPFDLENGTDTGGWISGGDLAASTLSAIYSTIYLGIAPSAMRAALAASPIAANDYTFVDIGCGKGRALLIAAEFPFRRLLGVELAPELCAIANANLALNPDWQSRISIINGDACTFVYPEGPLFIFLYTPFLIPVVRRFQANLESQLRRSPRPAYLLYANLFNTEADALADRSYPDTIEASSLFQSTFDTVYPLEPDEVMAERPDANFLRFVLYRNGLAD
jgi:SAM-dependent methyltransferase